MHLSVFLIRVGVATFSECFFTFLYDVLFMDMARIRDCPVIASDKTLVSGMHTGPRYCKWYTRIGTMAKVGLILKSVRQWRSFIYFWSCIHAAWLWGRSAKCSLLINIPCLDSNTARIFVYKTDIPCLDSNTTCFFLKYFVTKKSISLCIIRFP